ncbi:uncharacterized protein LOC131251035 isoform X2 [Magnolia sinica]|uniref:uncharacterized protein LOC131251035 isoform X2 n=1 Tax=Magnolia sinica TaxID=86752 RepID=UPI0026594F34|nr:uncharacterized protein LOC131251035 isoform X2 [Magnolia sinica]
MPLAEDPITDLQHKRATRSIRHRSGREMEKGVRRWMVDISLWDPGPDEFSSIISLLPLHEHSSITRFIKFKDRKRALVSRLLQYVLIHQVLGIPFDEIVIKRTIEGKPYLESGTGSSEFPNFNFNSSHHGDYVAIASEPLCLVGLDIVSHTLSKQETALEFIENFSSCLTNLEWQNIINAGSSDEILVEFYRYWCLKEAYVKAIGAGLGYGLDRLEFRHNNWTDISIHVDGEESRAWRFWLFDLGKQHWASVARGPPNRAVESYRIRLERVEFKEEEYYSSLKLPDAGFVFLTVDQLISMTSREK